MGDESTDSGAGRQEPMIIEERQCSAPGFLDSGFEVDPDFRTSS